MQKDPNYVKKLRQEALNWLKDLNNDEVSMIMAYSTPPPSLIFVIKYFYAMMTNQALDKNQQLCRKAIQQSPYGIDRMKLFYLFKLFMKQPNIQQILAQFNPIQLSPQTHDYLKRLKVQYLEGNQPKATDQKIQQIYAQLPHKLWNYCKCINKIKQISTISK